MGIKSLLIGILFGSQALWAADLYVSTSGSDSNSGIQSAPLRTISRASQIAQPGDVVHVAAGTYTGGFSTSANGTSSGAITYVSTVKWGAKIVPPSTAGSATAWDLGDSYVVVDGFEIDGQSNPNWRIGFWVSGSHSVVKNNHIHHILGSGCDSNGGAGIATDGYNGQGYHDILNNVIHHVGPGGAGSCGSFNGIYMESHDWTVKNNLVYQNSGDGLTSYHDSVRGQFINNTSFHNGRGIVCSGGGYYHISQGGPCIIENNIVYDNNPTSSSYTGGIAVSGLVSGSVVANNFIANNGGVAMGVDAAVSQSGNITSGSPGFVNYLADGSGNYHLASTSQLIDKGLSTYAPKNDLDGGARPVGAGFDIGAYEYGSVPATSPAPAPAPSPSPAPVPSAGLTVSASSVSPGGKITATISGLAQDATAWAGLYLASAADLDWSYQEKWMYLNGTQTVPAAPISSATLTFTAPMETGSYNIRVFANTGAGTRVAISGNISVVAAPDTTAPVTSITAPSNGSTVPRDSYPNFTASASDNVAVTKVQFLVNGSLVCTDTVAPYSCNKFHVSRRAGRSYSVQSKAFDAAGNVGSSAIVKFTTK